MPDIGCNVLHVEKVVGVSRVKALLVIAGVTLGLAGAGCSLPNISENEELLRDAQLRAIKMVVESGAFCDSITEVMEAFGIEKDGAVTLTVDAVVAGFEEQMPEQGLDVGVVEWLYDELQECPDPSDLAGVTQLAE